MVHGAPANPINGRLSSNSFLTLVIAFNLSFFGCNSPAVTNEADGQTTNAAGYDQLALTPPMGWNSWNAFHTDITEQKIKDAAQAMVSSGMKAAGYEYINIDDAWMDTVRDAQGRLQPDPKRFPHGIKAVADYCGTSLDMIQKDYCARLELNQNQTKIEPQSRNSVDCLASPTGFEPVLSA